MKAFLVFVVMFVLSMGSLVAEDWESVKSTKDPGYENLSTDGKLHLLLAKEYELYTWYYEKVGKPYADIFLEGFETKQFSGVRKVCDGYLNPTDESDGLKKKGQGGFFYFPQWAEGEIGKKVEAIGMTRQYQDFKTQVFEKNRLGCFVVAGAMAKTFIEFCQDSSNLATYQELKSVQLGAENIAGAGKGKCEQAIRDAVFSK